MESLLEFDYPTLSVFNPSVFNTDGSIVPTETNNIVKTWAALRPANDTTQLALVPGGMCVCVCVLLRLVKVQAKS